jgi:methylthioribulose-1-phosphate dehydratase
MSSASFAELARAVCEIGREAHARGWALGTSGNMSAVTSRDPLRLAITPSGADKGRLSAEQILEIDGAGRVIEGSGRPSDETRVHLAVVEARGAGAVLHTHSVWSTVLSEACAAEGGVAITGYEMLKGLAGVTTHEHREWLPILENDQDMPRLASIVRHALADHPSCHGFLLRRHGLYTWGATPADATRHVEILEFLLESVARAKEAASWRS